MATIESKLSQTFDARTLDEIRDLVEQAFEEGFEAGVEAREEIRKKHFHAQGDWDWESNWWMAIQKRKRHRWLTSVVQTIMCRLIGHK